MANNIFVHDFKIKMERTQWADLTKGIAILLVILGHSYIPAPSLCKLIFTFHMPLFFIIAGYFFNFKKYENNFGILLKKSAQRLLIPYTVSAFILMSYHNVFRSIVSYIYSSGSPPPELHIYNLSGPCGL